MASSTTTQTATTSFPTLSILGIVFIVLKLTHEIAWGWLWVLAPFWIPWAVVVAILVCAGLAFLVAAIADR